VTPSVPLGSSQPWDVPPHTLLATWDAESVVVWQAHGHRVADAVLARGSFDVPEWRTDRTSRFRVSLPSLLWRCSWGTRPGRERILAVRLSRSGFDEVLRRAVPADDDRAVYPTEASWRLAMRYATATVSWHPDRSLEGEPTAWDTARFGLRDSQLGAFAREWVRGVEDVSDWVAAQRPPEGVPREGQWPVVSPYPVGEAAGVR
jgi:hypothetical protein